ncbi:conserved hypothetical protein [Trichinella spiralis]|uniref:hypothetical protein n=2 Tax=Trichinella spiralis TaxID=6334 RepID=UPI0001EFE47A|nr:conserved hypothetical protein [Trichinella spiralis]
MKYIKHITLHLIISNRLLILVTLFKPDAQHITHENRIKPQHPSAQQMQHNSIHSQTQYQPQYYYTTANRHVAQVVNRSAKIRSTQNAQVPNVTDDFIHAYTHTNQVILLCLDYKENLHN